MTPRRGLALVLVVGVLGVLAVLGSAFAVLSRLERKAAAQRVLGTQALLLARSGIEDATARLGMGQDPDAADNRYGGEDWDGSGGVLSVLEAANEVYRPGNPDRESCPVQQAMRPSFSERISPGNPNPATLPMGGRLRGVSGNLKTGHYALKVMPQAGFFVNGGDPAAAYTVGYNLVLYRILGTLAEAIDREVSPPRTGADDGSPVDQTDGRNLILLRPRTARGWESWEQMKALALGGSQEKLDALKPYLTLFAQVDRKVVAPNAPSMTSGPALSTFTDFMLSHQKVIPGGASHAPDFERIPAATGRIVGRAPVNLAWARKRKPALIALLAGLAGVFVDEMGASGAKMANDLSQDRVGRKAATQIWLSWAGPTDDCRSLADQILASTSELATWQQFNDFCDTLDVNNGFIVAPSFRNPDLQRRWGRQAKRDILKANFNPNTDLNLFNPNALQWKRVDKSDLAGYSTELSLSPVHGHEIECQGRVLSSQGRLLAARRLSCSLAPPSITRLTTQKEFVCSDLGNPDVSGDETGFRLPGSSPFVSLNRSLEKTWGHRLNGLEGQGVSLQSYPEPVLDPGTGLSLRPADYDGNLQLATLETENDRFYGADLAPVPPPVLDMKMLAPFTTTPDLAVADAWPANPNARKAQPATGSGAYIPSLLTATSSVSPFRRPEYLRPDGAYSDRGWAPAFLDRGNANGFHGVLSFWIKMNYEFSNNAGDMGVQCLRQREWVKRTHHKRMATAGRRAGGVDNQFWTLGDCFTTDPQIGVGAAPSSLVRRITTLFETSRDRDDTDSEFSFATPGDVPDNQVAHRWYLVTQFWDFNSLSPGFGGGDTNDMGEIILNAGTAQSQRGSGCNYVVASPGGVPFKAQDLTDDDDFGPHTTSLGYGPTQSTGASGTFPIGSAIPTAMGTGLGADATFDEFAIYDFGGAPLDCSSPTPSETLAAVDVLALKRFREGRYYRPSAYRRANAPGWIQDEAASYVTPLLRLPQGSRLDSVHWTWYRPSALPDDYAEIELVTPAADAYVRSDESLCRSTLGPGWTVDRQTWNLPKALSPDPAGLRLRVVFRRRTPLDGNAPILESPVLDDLAIVCRSAGGARILSWTEGEPGRHPAPEPPAPPEDPGDEEDPDPEGRPR